MLLPVEAPKTHAQDDLAALLKRVMVETGLSQSSIAERSGIPLATLNAWITRRRSPGKGTKSGAVLRQLAGALPGVTVEQVFRAAGRQVPGQMAPDAEQRILEMFRSLGPHRQDLAARMMKTLMEEERPPQS